MPRKARLVVPEIPHHVVQRGNRNMLVFFDESDKRLYLRLLKEQSEKHSVQIWAYCLMDNHVHLIAVPSSPSGLAAALANTHWHYSRLINFKKNWRGYLWQGRFFSCPMDEEYLFAAVRYVEQNPVKAGLVQNAEDYPWSSAKAHVKHSKDEILSDCFLTNHITDWSDYLKVASERDHEMIEKHTRTGKPLGSEFFTHQIENKLNNYLLD